MCYRINLGIVLLFILMLPTIETTAQDENKKLNVIFILADDLGWTDLGGYGSDLHETPNLDQLAHDGLKFTNAYAAAPICSPTRASIMTGKAPARLHLTTWFENSGLPKPKSEEKLVGPCTIGNLPLSENTLAEMFRQAGYFTAHIGKWHLGDAMHYPQTQGFDISIGASLWGAPDTYWYPFRGEKNSAEYRYIPELVEESDQKGTISPYLTDNLTDRAVEIIKRKEDKPFFLNIWYHTVHTPIEGKPELVEYFKNKVRPDMKDQNYIYAAMVASLDQNVGRILKAVDDVGIANRTIIIFFSDNGGRVGRYRNWKTVANNSPLRSGKGSLYEGGIRVPLIIKWPGMTKAGSICNYPIISNDFYPTLLEIPGIGNKITKTTQKLDGISLIPLLKNPKGKLSRETLYWHSPHYYSTTSPVSAIRKGNWKLIHYFDDDHLELYSLDKDLGETNNLADILPEKTTELYESLRVWRNDIGAQLPSFNPLYKSEKW